MGERNGLFDVLMVVICLQLEDEIKAIFTWDVKYLFSNRIASVNIESLSYLNNVLVTMRKMLNIEDSVYFSVRSEIVME